MTLLLAGQLAGLAFACGLDLYLTVALVGILARLGVLSTLPPGLEGLAGTVVLASALAMFAVEAVVDRIRHADSVWDTVHTFIRPPAAALLAVGVTWGQPVRVIIIGALLGFLVALIAHGTKAGLRMNLNATMHGRWQSWISILEDALAATLAVFTFLFPVRTLVAVAVALLVSLAFAPRLWGAFGLGVRGVTAWVRSIFLPAGWREGNALPGDVRAILGETPIGAAPPRGTRATLHAMGAVAPFRNGWLILTDRGPVFSYRTLLGTRRIDLPPPRAVEHEPGVWADILRVHTDEDTDYTLFLLRDGPPIELAVRNLSPETS
ncbi:MAG: DUF4126 domain-containing protein [Candidatus Longimicrobiales bacterium M2_2A_002]